MLNLSGQTEQIGSPGTYNPQIRGETNMEIKPQAMAIPKETDKLEKGKYGPIYLKTPACYGFTIIAKIIAGREPIFHEYAKILEKAREKRCVCRSGSSGMAHGRRRTRAVRRTITTK
jgi:hypothetical protein